MAQGMVSEIKIVAVQKTDSLAPQAEGYSGANDFDLDFRKGRGGGYVFAIFKKDTNPNLYITDVRVEKREMLQQAMPQSIPMVRPPLNHPPTNHRNHSTATT